MNYAAQLVLGIRLQDDATFSNFFGEQNSQLVAHLKQFLQENEEHFFYIAGLQGSGKSHLLQACCHEMAAYDKSAVYIPLSNLQELNVKILDDLEYVEMICIDDIQCVAEHPEWQEALMHLYNRSRATKAKLIVSGDLPPRELPLALADLKSRLSWGLMYQLLPLNDEDKVVTLQVRAKERGFELTNEVANFLLRRCSREMPTLFELLERLDHASLSAQRRLTIPFVKEVLGV